MSKTLSISIPHRLTQEQAKQRIVEGIARARTQFAGNVANIEQTWTGDQLAFKLGIMGQSIAGRLNVQPQTVHLEIDLPWMLAMMAGKIQQQIETEGKKLLAHDEPKSA